jgi:hypothetical protein
MKFRQTDRQTGDLICLLSLLESRLKIGTAIFPPQTHTHEEENSLHCDENFR